MSFDKARELIENDKVDNDRATQLAMVSNGNMHLAKALVLKDIDRPLKEAYNLLNSFTLLDQNTWRNTINNLVEFK